MPSTTSLGSRVTKLLKTPGLNNAKSSQQTPGSSTSSGSGTSPHLLALVVATSSIVAFLVVIGVAVWWRTFRVRQRRRLFFRTRGGSDSDTDPEAKAKVGVRGDVQVDGLSFGSYREREDLMEGGLGLGLGLGPVLDIRANSTGTGTRIGSVNLDKVSHGHEHDLPVIVISASGRDLSNFKNTANDAEIYGYDHVAINSTNARLDVDITVNTGNEHETEDTSGSSFYSDEMLEEISSIAADLKRFSRARSLDVEVKSIDSVKSFAMIVEVPDHHEEQGLSAESVDVFDNDDPSGRDSMDEAIESLEALLLSLERMANERVHDESQAYSDDSVYSDDSAYLSTISTPVPVPVFVPIVERVSVKRPKPMETIIEEDSVELSIVDRLNPIPGTPTTPGTSSDTTLRDDEFCVPSTSTPKKGTSSDTISALITALSSSPTVDDNTDSDFPKDASPTTGTTTLTLQPIAQHVLPGGTRAYLPFVNSVVTLRGRAHESEPSRPALVRLPLGEVKSVNRLTAAPPRPPRRGRGRGHVRTSSRDKSENSRRTKGGVPVLTDSLRPY